MEKLRNLNANKNSIHKECTEYGIRKTCPQSPHCESALVWGFQMGKKGSIFSADSFWERGGFFYYANLEGPFESEDAARQWAADNSARFKALELSSPGDLVIRERDGGYYYDAIVAGPFESEDAAQQWAAGARPCPQAAPDTERDAPVPHSDKKSNGWGRHILDADDERLVLMQRLAALQRKQGLPVSYPLELGNVSNEEIAQRIAALEGQGERDEGAVQQQVMEGLA